MASTKYDLAKTQRKEAEIWVDRLLNRAYGAAQRQKRIKILINPFGGKGNAQRRFSKDIEPILAAARCVVHVERTQYKGHAVEIAEKLDADAYDVIASCSGDGLPHEVFNGLGRKKDASKALAKVAVVQLPCGSGNAMSLNLNGTDSPSLAALAVVKGLRTPLDLISITQSDRRTLSFLSQSFGIVAESDLGTEHIRWMGAARFTYGVLERILAKTVYPCDVAVQLVDGDKASIKRNHREYMNAQCSGPDNIPLHKHVSSSSSGISSSESPRSDDGLPPLRFGTVQDPLPPTWHMASYPKLGNFYAGNMLHMAAATPFFPYALPSDGCIDLVTVDFDCSRWGAVKTLLAVGNGTLFDMESVQYRKVEGYRILPREKKGYVSVDGERVPFEPFQVEVHRGLGCVLSRHGSGFEEPAES